MIIMIILLLTIITQLNAFRYFLGPGLLTHLKVLFIDWACNFLSLFCFLFVCFLFFQKNNLEKLFINNISKSSLILNVCVYLKANELLMDIFLPCSHDAVTIHQSTRYTQSVLTYFFSLAISIMMNFILLMNTKRILILLFILPLVVLFLFLLLTRQNCDPFFPLIHVVYAAEQASKSQGTARKRSSSFSPTAPRSPQESKCS